MEINHMQSLGTGLLDLEQFSADTSRLLLDSTIIQFLWLSSTSWYGCVTVDENVYPMKDIRVLSTVWLLYIKSSLLLAEAVSVPM